MTADSVPVRSARVDGPAPVGAVRPRAGLTPYRVVALVVIAAVLLSLVRLLLVQTYVIPSSSMQPGLQVGDRVLVWRPGSVRRGDVIVFDGTGIFVPQPVPPASELARVGRTLAAAMGSPVEESDFVKRVIGLPGDHVICCAAGHLVVNGQRLAEPYLAPGDAASAVPFNVLVPGGRLWVMGDHRSVSADSRAHLGDPGGGMVPLTRVIGRVVAVWWPFGRARGVGRVDPLLDRAAP